MKKNRRKKRTKIKREIVVLLAIISILVVAVALYLNARARAPKKPAEGYFSIFDNTINDAEPRTNDTVIVRWIIYGISFKIQAADGDAHDVIILSWAKAEPVYIGDIPKGEWRYVSQTSSRPFGYMSQIDEDGKVPMKIRITSKEAEGTVTIYF